MDLCIGIDLMGGDLPPSLIFEAVLQVAKKCDVRFVVFSTHALYSTLQNAEYPQIEFVTTEEFIEIDESPLLAVRRKKNSSMAAGMRLLKNKKIDALVTTGNTGALVATAMRHLNTLPGIERPALLVAIPTAKGEVVVLDVGANVQPKPAQLLSYARLGSLFSTYFYRKALPRIGLLNIGAEEQKGTPELKETYYKLQEMFKEQFVGNIEGRDVFQGKVDVLITDGFTGNVFLKTSEGISHFLFDYLSDRFEIPEVVSHLNRKFNYAEHPGGFLCGIDGVIIKCHGYSDRQALTNGIYGAIELVRLQVNVLMRKNL